MVSRLRGRPDHEVRTLSPGVVIVAALATAVYAALMSGRVRQACAGMIVVLSLAMTAAVLLAGLVALVMALFRREEPGG